MASMDREIERCPPTLGRSRRPESRRRAAAPLRPPGLRRGALAAAVCLWTADGAGEGALPVGFWSVSYSLDGQAADDSYSALYAVERTGRVLGLRGTGTKIGRLEPGAPGETCPDGGPVLHLLGLHRGGLYEEWCAYKTRWGLRLSVVVRSTSVRTLRMSGAGRRPLRPLLLPVAHCPAMPGEGCSAHASAGASRSLGLVKALTRPVERFARDLLRHFQWEAMEYRSDGALAALRQRYARVLELVESLRLLLCGWLYRTVAPGSCWGATGEEAQGAFDRLVAPLCEDLPELMRQSSLELVGWITLCDQLFWRRDIVSYRPRRLTSEAQVGLHLYMTSVLHVLINTTSFRHRNGEIWPSFVGEQMASSTSLPIGRDAAAAIAKGKLPSPKYLGQLWYPSRFAEGMCEPSVLESPGLGLGMKRFAQAQMDPTGLFAANLELGRLFVHLQNEGVRLSNTLVNLGAGDGQCVQGDMAGYDVANCLLLQQFPRFDAVLVEAVEANRPAIQEIRESLNLKIEIVMEAVSPLSVLRTCNAALARLVGSETGTGGPTPGEELDLLKVDIDSEDYGVVHSLVWVGGWRPKAIQVEISPLVSPPLQYIHLGSAHGHLETSLAAFVALLAPLYALVQVEFMNALFLRQDLADRHLPENRERSVLEKWAAGYYCHPLRSFWGSYERRLQLEGGLDPRALADPTDRQDVALRSRGGWLLVALRNMDRGSPACKQDDEGCEPAEVGARNLSAPRPAAPFMLRWPPDAADLTA